MPTRADGIAGRPGASGRDNIHIQVAVDQSPRETGELRALTPASPGLNRNSRAVAF